MWRHCAEFLLRNQAKTSRGLLLSINVMQQWRGRMPSERSLCSLYHDEKQNCVSRGLQTNGPVWRPSQSIITLHSLYCDEKWNCISRGRKQRSSKKTESQSVIAVEPGGCATRGSLLSVGVVGTWGNSQFLALKNNLHNVKLYLKFISQFLTSKNYKQNL